MRQIETPSDCKRLRPRIPRRAAAVCALGCLVIAAVSNTAAQEEAGGAPEMPGNRQPAAELPKVAIPKAHQVDRYLDIWKKSPFQREAAPIARSAIQSFARDYAVLGFISWGDNPVVTLINKKTRETTRITQESPKDGFQLLEVKRGEGPRDLTVTVSRDGETADLTFDNTFLNTPAGLAKAAPNPAKNPASTQQGRSLLAAQQNKITRPNSQGSGVVLPGNANPDRPTVVQPQTKPAPPPASPAPAVGNQSGTSDSGYGPTQGSRRRVVLPNPR